MPLTKANKTIINAVVVNATATVNSPWQKGSPGENFTFFTLLVDAGTPSVDYYLDRSPFDPSDKAAPATNDTLLLIKDSTDTTLYTSTKFTSAETTAETMEEWTAEDLSKRVLDRPCGAWRFRIVGGATNPATTAATVHRVLAV